jgi:uncharacterized protein involved in exopolysaccharide biosynthesis
MGDTVSETECDHVDLFMNDSAPQLEMAGSDLSLRELVALIWVRRWRVVGTVLLFAAASASVAFLITPTYEGSVILVPANTERIGESLGGAAGQLGNIASVVGLNLNSRGSSTDEALAILRSRQFTEAFISERQLMPELFARKWDAQRKQWKGPTDKQPTLAKAYKYFDKEIREITQDKKTGLVTLRVIWKDRNEASEWANDLARRLNSEMRTRALQREDLAAGYLDRELRSTTEVVAREAIGRLIESQLKQRMLANVTQEYAFRVVDRAMPADADDRVGPHRVQLIVGGTIAGFGLVVLWIYVSASLRPQLPVRSRI